MKKSILEGILNPIFAAIDATAAWALWSLVSIHPISWPEWWIICFTGIGVVRSATRAWRGQNVDVEAPPLLKSDCAETE